MRSCTGLLACSISLFSADLGMISGRITSGGIPIKGKVYIFKESRIQAQQPTETTAVVFATRRYLFGVDITFQGSAPGVYVIATDRRGHFSHAGLPVGIYSVAAEVRGEIVEQVAGVKVSKQSPSIIEFKVAQKQHEQ